MKRSKAEVIIGIVCPKCGQVVNLEGKVVDVATGMSFWNRQGYETKLCDDCLGKKETSHNG